LLIALAAAYPKLPDISAMTDYRPKQPLRIFTQDEILIGEFGEEKRQFVPFAKIPKTMKQAVLAAEDANFYEHGGVDYRGLLRSVVTNVLTAQKAQGGSTISMQVARNIYLSAEKTYTRKIYEILLTYKLEHLLSKDQILEVYLNQIFLGNRAFGFAAASLTYFGKPLNKLTLAETAMLAGIPKAPSAYNPFRNPKRAKARQQFAPVKLWVARLLKLAHIQREGLIRREDRTIHPVVGWLVCIEGPDQGRDFRIRSERNHIGRAAELDIAIAGDDRISRQSHAGISYNPKKHRFSLAPGSGNGLTYLNDNEVLMPETLNAYDMIELGVSKLLFIPFCGARFSWQDGLTQATPTPASNS